jgi:hypothetical protein
MMDFYDELRGLVAALEEHHVEYAICGGVALAFHGYPRFTKDIDLLIPPTERDRVLEIAERRGFLDPAGRIPFENGEVYRTSKIVGTDILTLDLLLVNTSLADVWNGREVYGWKGLDVQVVSAQGLVKMKRMAGRDQDLVDIKRLESHDGEDRKPTVDETS